MLLLALLLGLSTCWAAAQETLDDPMRPSYRRPEPASAASGPRAPAWRLRSTIVGGRRSLAVINDRTLTVGEAVDGARLVEIAPGRVTLEAGGRRFELTLTRRDVKQMRSE